MTYNKLGKTGLKVSAIGLDTWQFNGEWGGRNLISRMLARS